MRGNGQERSQVGGSGQGAAVKKGEVIPQKEGKNRMINCNFSPLLATTPLPNSKGSRPVTAGESNRSKLSQSLKKSYFYRKWLNKSIDSQFTSEQFVKYKQKFNSSKTHLDENPLSFLRDVWEQECQQRLSERLVEGSTRTLQQGEPSHREGRKDGKNLTFVQFIERKKSGESRNRSVVKMVEERPICVNFDLEIQGNCKNIKQREAMGKARQKRPIQGNALLTKTHRKSLSEEVNPESNSQLSTLQELQVLDIALSSQNSCNFLKHQGQGQLHFPPQPPYTPGLNIRSLKNEEVVDYFHFAQGDRVRNKQRLLMNFNKSNQDGRLKMGVFEWKSKGKRSNFVNDIAGWAVGRDNEEPEMADSMML